MNANKLKFWQITGNGIQQNRTTHGSHWCTIFEIYQAMSNLHLNWHIKFHTFRIKWIVSSVIWFHIKPMRIKVGTYKTHILNCGLQCFDPFHAFKRIYPSQAIKAIRVCSNNSSNFFIRH